MKKAMDISALQKRVIKKPLIDKFARADAVLGTQEEAPIERAIRKSYTITQLDIDRLQKIKNRCLNERVVIQESHLIRIGIMLVDEMKTLDIIEAFNKISIIPVGRPKKTNI